MGYYYDKLMNVWLNGPYARGWVESRYGRRLVMLILFLRREITEEIPSLAKYKHYVTQVSKHQKKVEEEAKEAGKDMFGLAFQADLNQQKTLGMVKEIENELINARKRAASEGNQKVIRALNDIEKKEGFQNKLVRILEEDKGRERYVYFKLLAPIAKETKETGSHEELMARVRLLFKKEDVSRLFATAIRWEVRKIRKSIIGLEKDEAQIKKLIKGIRSKDAEVEKVVKNLRECVERIEFCTRNEFRNAFLLWKRDFLLSLILLRLLDTDEAEMMEFVKEHNLPKSLGMKSIENIEEIKKGIAKNVRVLAQGFRILIGEEERIEAEAKEEIRLAEREGL